MDPSKKTALKLKKKGEESRVIGTFITCFKYIHYLKGVNEMKERQKKVRGILKKCAVWSMMGVMMLGLVACGGNDKKMRR